MKDGETVLIDLGTGVLRLKRWQTRGCHAYSITLMVPALETEHYMAPAESCSTSFNSEQAAQIVAALSDTPSTPQSKGQQNGT